MRFPSRSFSCIGPRRCSPDATVKSEREFQEVVENKVFRRGVRNQVVNDGGRRVQRIDGCQHADSGSSEMRIGYPTEEERMWRETSAPQGVMRSQSGAIAECLTNSQSRRLRNCI